MLFHIYIIFVYKKLSLISWSDTSKQYCDFTGYYIIYLFFIIYFYYKINILISNDYSYYIYL